MDVGTVRANDTENVRCKGGVNASE